MIHDLCIHVNVPLKVNQNLFGQVLIPLDDGILSTSLSFELNHRMNDKSKIEASRKI